MKNGLSHLSPLDDRTRGEAVLEALSEMIAKAQIRPGDKLPPETALAKHLGVGRSTMREALNKWEGLGLIRRMRGDGTYLAGEITALAGAQPVLVQLEGAQILRMLEVRRVLEMETARKAAERASDDQRGLILALAHDLMASVAAGCPSPEIDMRFHQAIADATGNPVYAQMIGQLKQASLKSPSSPFAANTFAAASFPLHVALAEAIRRGDAEAAAAEVARIFDAVEEDVRLALRTAPKSP